MKKRILGIDTGTNSLGWAVVDKQENGKYSLVSKGSLIFQEGVKVEKGIESSKAADRTAHRALRKQYFRRRLRKIKVLKVLIEFGWCPYLSPEALHQWHVKKEYPMDEAFISWQRTNDNFDENPYYYRHRCLHEQLDLNEKSDSYILGRAMYHLAQRRGFLSNRLEQGDDDETGKVKEGISSLSKSMADAGCEYLGDFFYKIYKEKGNTERIRTRYTDREEHYKKEFYAICKQQRLSEEQISKLEKALYFQRPLKSQRQGVGKCTFEPKKARVADSHPAFELFRMLSFVNNIKIKGPQDVELRPLSQEEFEKAKPMFFRKSKPQFDFEDIAKAIAGKGKYQHIKDDKHPDDPEHRITLPAFLRLLHAGASVSFAGRMKDDYAYPYSNTVQYFKNDDFTISNLECTLSDRKLSSAEQWYFLAPTAYANILLEGGVDFVTTANNHMEDFGQKGVDDTYAALEEYGIPYGKEGEARLITTDSGLVLGIYCDYNHLNPDAEKSAAAVRQLRADGAEYVICAFHWGKELYYSPNDDQIALAHACIDAGADLIYGSHTHNLQPIEQYGKGLILYSMGNWSFGGSTAPSDRDTAIVQVKLHRDETGKVTTTTTTTAPPPTPRGAKLITGCSPSWTAASSRTRRAAITRTCTPNIRERPGTPHTESKPPEANASGGLLCFSASCGSNGYPINTRPSMRPEWRQPAPGSMTVRLPYTLHRPPRPAPCCLAKLCLLSIGGRIRGRRGGARSPP